MKKAALALLCFFSLTPAKADLRIVSPYGIFNVTFPFTSSQIYHASATFKDDTIGINGVEYTFPAALPGALSCFKVDNTGVITFGSCGGGASGGGGGGGFLYDGTQFIAFSTLSPLGATIVSDGLGSSTITWNPVILSTYNALRTTSTFISNGIMPVFSSVTAVYVNVNSTRTFLLTTLSTTSARIDEIQADLSTHSLRDLSHEVTFSTISDKLNNPITIYDDSNPQGNAGTLVFQPGDDTSQGPNLIFTLGSSGATTQIKIAGYGNFFDTLTDHMSTASTRNDAQDQRTVVIGDEGGAGAAHVTKLDIVGAGGSYSQSGTTGTLTIGGGGGGLGVTEAQWNTHVTTGDRTNEHQNSTLTAVNVATTALKTDVWIAINSTDSAGKVHSSSAQVMMQLIRLATGTYAAVIAIDTTTLRTLAFTAINSTDAASKIHSSTSQVMMQLIRLATGTYAAVIAVDTTTLRTLAFTAINSTDAASKVHSSSSQVMMQLIRLATGTYAAQVALDTSTIRDLLAQRTLTMREEGAALVGGAITSIDCIGGAITCAQSGSSVTVTIAGAGGVSSIIAGTGITIDPVGGTGDVTINATGGPGGGGTAGPHGLRISSFTTVTEVSISTLYVVGASSVAYWGQNGATITFRARGILHPEVAQFRVTNFPQVNVSTFLTMPESGLLYDAALSETAYWKLHAHNWNPQTSSMTVNIYWRADNPATTTGDVRWGVQIGTMTPDAQVTDSLTNFFTTTHTVTQTHLGTRARRPHDASVGFSAQDLAGLQNEGMVYVAIHRHGNNAGDTMTGDVQKIYATIEW
jgi:hypothetical protein